VLRKTRCNFEQNGQKRREKLSLMSSSLRCGPVVGKRLKTSKNRLLVDPQPHQRRKLGTPHFGARHGLSDQKVCAKPLIYQQVSGTTLEKFAAVKTRDWAVMDSNHRPKD
jgi:hypothetical protein